MKLSDLLLCIEERTVVWIGTSENDADGIYFGEVEGVTCGLLSKYAARTFYPERYPSIPCIGITILVDPPPNVSGVIKSMKRRTGINGSALSVTKKSA